MTKQTSADLAEQIRVDLRSALRLWDELRAPLTAFMTDETKEIGQPRFYILFDLQPRKQIVGLKIGVRSLEIYDEPLIHKTHEFAGKVWHLKDKLAKYARRKQITIRIDEYIDQRRPLMIVADLSNANKHFGNPDRSGLRPIIETVRIDTSKSGLLELFLDGATKEKEILVTRKHPIPLVVELKTAGASVPEDAVKVIRDALDGWIPLLRQLDVLAGDNPEAEYLRERLRINTVVQE